MSMRCLTVMCYAPAPSHHRLLPLANSCRALCPNSTSPTLGHRTSDPDILSILTLLAFHHSHQALAVTLSFPHPPSPILATFLSMACVLKRFLLTSLRKFSLTCVKRGFLRTAEPHRTSQLSPCAPQVSQCHVYAMPGRDVPCPSPPHHRLLPRANSCLALCPNPTTPTLPIAHLTPYPLSILPLLACHSLPTRFPSLSRRTFHPFLISTLALSNSSHVSFHGVRTKTFSTHVTT